MRTAITVSSLSPWQSLYLLLDKLEPRSLFFLLLAMLVVSWLLLAGLIGSVGRVRRARWEAFSRMHVESSPAPEGSLFAPNVTPDPAAPKLPIRPLKSKENDQ